MLNGDMRDFITCSYHKQCLCGSLPVLEELIDFQNIREKANHSVENVAF